MRMLIRRCAQKLPPTVELGVEADQEFAPEVAQIHLPTWRPCTDIESAAVFRLHRPAGREVVIEHPPISIVLVEKSGPVATLEKRLHMYLAENAKKAVYVHAGVVKWNGRAIVLPGHTWSGKSRLVKALVKAGAKYMSDEYAIIDRQGLVSSFPRPLQLRGSGGSERIRVQELGWEGAVDPVSVSTVLALRYQRGAGLDVSPLSAGEAVMELLKHVVSAWDETELSARC